MDFFVIFLFLWILKRLRKYLLRLLIKIFLFSIKPLFINVKLYAFFVCFFFAVISRTPWSNLSTLMWISKKLLDGFLLQFSADIFLNLVDQTISSLKRKLVQNVEGTDCIFTAEVPRQLCRRIIPRSFEDKRVARFEPFNPF